MCPLYNLNLTIDRVYEELLNKLTAHQKIGDVTKELLALQDNGKRVLYVYNLIKGYNILPLVIKVIKCYNVSTYYRSHGNLLFQRNQLYGAWQYYNLALMYSPLPLPTYALAVANRSAVFAALKEYRACLKDVNYVLEQSYPEEIRAKLLRRKKLCEDALQKEEGADFDGFHRNVDEIFTLKGQKNERFVSASTKLEVVHTQELGRHVIAKEDIEVGEVLVQEDPFTRVLLKSQYLYCCAYCTSRIMNLYPCPFCCVTMYCSRECVIKAGDEYHPFECPLAASLVKMAFSKLELLALRATIKARAEHDDWQSVLDTAAAAESTINTEYWGHVKEGDKWVYDSKYYTPIHTLATNIEKRDISDIFQKCVSAAVLTHCLAVANFVKTDDANLKKRITHFTAKTLLHHLMTAPTNMHGITTNIETDEGNYVDEYNIGSAAYPFLSLINHSCAPNVVRYTRLGATQMTLFALRPIKKGMQILDNYGYNAKVWDDRTYVSLVITKCVPRDIRICDEIWATRGCPAKIAHHAVHEKKERQGILRSQYKFICLCEACIEDWPLYKYLPLIPNLPPDLAIKKEECLSCSVNEALQKGDRKCALQMFKPLCELATALEPYIPCKEAAECQETLKQCLTIMSGVLRKDFNNLANWSIPPPDIPGLPVTSRFYTGDGAYNLT